MATSCPREAAAKSKRAWLATEDAFKMISLHPALAAAQARALIDQLLQESVFASPTADALVAALGSDDRGVAKLLLSEAGVDQVMALPEEQRTRMGMHIYRIADRAMAERAIREMRAEREHSDAIAVFVEQAQARALDAEARLAVRDAPVSLPSPVIDAPEPGVAKPAVHAKKAKCPLFSSVIEPFLLDKCRGEDGYSGQTVSQVRSTFRLWLDLVGDKPVADYTGTEAGSFRELALRLPASHGKGGRVDALEAIRAADRRELGGQLVPRLSMKTAKRHFSALSQLWVWLQPRAHIDKNIFRGFTFPGTKNTRHRRSDWSDADLVTLFSSPWFSTPVQVDSAQRWLPLIAMFSGLRLEEAARLRVGHDIVDLDGVPAFRIQAHPDGWSPKSEAGERIVPVHPVLVEFGLMDVVGRRRDAGQVRLWPELVESGPDGKLSAGFGRRFGKLKDGLGVPKATTFHSFRHNASTILRNTTTSENWIDAILGHEGEGRSVGASIYLKRIGITNLQATVAAIGYSEVVMAAVRKAMCVDGD